MMSDLFLVGEENTRHMYFKLQSIIGKRIKKKQRYVFLTRYIIYIYFFFNTVFGTMYDVLCTAWYGAGIYLQITN